jgi:hypothetical protein
MTKDYFVGHRPAHIQPPAYLSKSPPVPAPQAPKRPQETSIPTAETPGRLDPTRYGDWEKAGIAIDF